MRERAALFERDFVERQIERRILDIELRIPYAHLAWLNSQHLFVKLRAALHIFHIQRQMRLERLHTPCLNFFHLNLLKNRSDFIFACANMSAAYARQTYLSRRIFSSCAKMFP